MNLLYTALNLPSLIFALYKSETDLPSLEFADSPIFLNYPSDLAYYSISPVLNSPSIQRVKMQKKNGRGDFPCIQYNSVKSNNEQNSPHY